MRTLKDIDAVGMSIVRGEFPPNIDEIAAVFPFVRDKAKPILYAYGDKIYNPASVYIPVHLLAHECIHSLQQRDTTVELWWQRYLADAEFRFEQELEAHRVEYERYGKDWSRPFRRHYIKTCAERLAGPLYGNHVSRDKAKRLILED